MKKLNYVIASLIMMFVISSCKQVEQDTYLPSYLANFKKYESQAGDISRVLAKFKGKKKHRAIIYDDNLPTGIYNIGDDEYISIGRDEESGFYSISQMVEYNSLSQSVRDYIENNPPHGSGRFIMSHKEIDDMTIDEVDISKLYVEFVQRNYIETDTISDFQLRIMSGDMFYRMMVSYKNFEDRIPDDVVAYTYMFDENFNPEPIVD